jgi:hypothetical protein
VLHVMLANGSVHVDELSGFFFKLTLLLNNFIYNYLTHDALNFWIKFVNLKIKDSRRLCEVTKSFLKLMECLRIPAATFSLTDNCSNTMGCYGKSLCKKYFLLKFYLTLTIRARFIFL